MSARAPQLSERDLQQWKLISDFRSRLEALCHPQDPRWQDRRRRLQLFDYLSLFLFGLVNPVLKSLRGLSAASDLTRVQKEVCGSYASLGSLSEAQHLLDPALLEKLLASLQEQIQGPAPKDPRQAWQLWLARDSSIFEATSRMFWAQYGGGKPSKKGPHHAVRFHVSLHLWDQEPSSVAVTAGKVCERRMWREQLEQGATYVGDRYFGQDYKMFGLLEEMGCHFVLRLRDEAILSLLEQNALTEADRAAGILDDAWVQLGSAKRYQTGRVRVVTVRKPCGKIMRLVTNFTPQQMSARDILTLYRRRWQIECYFRWIKCLLGCRHWLAQSQAGVTVQLYLAAIAGLLLHLVLGRRPNKRLWEKMQFYLMGWATADELASAVQQALEQPSAKKA